MSISNKQIALIHVAKSKLGLTEAEFRSGLVDLCGVTSVTELDQDGFTALMGLFEYLGFKPLTAKGAGLWRAGRHGQLRPARTDQDDLEGVVRCRCLKTVCRSGWNGTSACPACAS